MSESDLNLPHINGIGMLSYVQLQCAVVSITTCVCVTPFLRFGWCYVPIITVNISNCTSKTLD